MNVNWAKVKRQQANNSDAVAAIASGIGEYGIANACYRLAGILRKQADEIESAVSAEAAEPPPL